MVHVFRLNLLRANYVDDWYTLRICQLPTDAVVVCAKLFLDLARAMFFKGKFHKRRVFGAQFWGFTHSFGPGKTIKTVPYLEKFKMLYNSDILRMTIFIFKFVVLKFLPRPL